MFKPLILIRVALVIPVLLFVNACDPIHIVRYGITCSSEKDTDNGMLYILDIIDKVAIKHQMIRKYDYKIDGNENICRYYFGKYETHGPISSSKKDVSLKVMSDYMTKSLTIEVIDLFKNTQSYFSKDIEIDLVNTIKQYSSSCVIEYK